eukprot:1161045-Pelagomonas_calceolata.AAC.10
MQVCAPASRGACLDYEAATEHSSSRAPRLSYTLCRRLRVKGRTWLMTKCHHSVTQQVSRPVHANSSQFQ